MKLQKRLASAVLKCGKNKIWLDPNENNEIANANSRDHIRKLIKDGLIIRKPVVVHSRYRFLERKAAKKLGRHKGLGKRRGTKNARNSIKSNWIKRIRILRKLLKKYRERKTINKRFYHTLYKKIKGGHYKHKRMLSEYIHRTLTERARLKAMADAGEARRQKGKEMRKRKAERAVAKRQERLAAYAKEDAAAAAVPATASKTTGDRPAGKAK